MSNRYMRRSDGSTGSIPQDLILTLRVPAAADAITLNFWNCNDDYEFVGIREVHGTASTSGTVTVEKCTGTTAPGAGTAISSAVSTAGAANTVVAGTLAGTQAQRRFTVGDRLTLKWAGTVTNLVNSFVTVYLKKVQAFGAER